MNQIPNIEEAKLAGKVVVCDGLYTGKVGTILGTGSSQYSIKLLVDGVERYEPDYALLHVTEDNEQAVKLLLTHHQLQKVRHDWLREEKERTIDFLLEEGYLKGRELIPHDESKKSHGTCCYCGTCGHDNDNCVCEHNRLLQTIIDRYHSELDQAEPISITSAQKVEKVSQAELEGGLVDSLIKNKIWREQEKKGNTEN